MGYRSEVGLKVHFTTITDRDRTIAMLPEEQQQMVREMLTIPADRPVLYAHFGDIKWYASSAMSGYEQIDAVEALLDLCQQETDNLNDGDGDAIPNAGFFARIGEETGDEEERFWQPDWAWTQEHPEAGLPEPYDMGQIQRFIEMDED